MCVSLQHLLNAEALRSSRDLGIQLSSEVLKSFAETYTLRWQEYLKSVTVGDFCKKT